MKPCSRMSQCQVDLVLKPNIERPSSKVHYFVSCVHLAIIPTNANATQSANIIDPFNPILGSTILASFIQRRHKITDPFSPNVVP